MTTEQQQLVLDIPGLPPLQVDPTPAMKSGQQSISQCSWCGCVVIPPKPATHQLGACPSCGKHTDWWQQRLPLAGVDRFRGDQSGSAVIARGAE